MRAQTSRSPQRRAHAAPLRRELIAVLVAACYTGAEAGPLNPTVIAGQASFNVQGKTYSITNTPNTIVNWQSFSLASDEIARFIQQGADSRVLNRITGQDPTRILGALQSNGKVFLINPNGVMFGAGSRVDVNGLVASSLAISNADFLSGNNNFSGAATAGKVANAGAITTPAGGQIFLIAPAVENSGVISAPNGDVVLAAGHSVQLFDSKNPDVQVVLSAPDNQALNLGRIVAQGGRVGVYGALVNQRGAINANSAVRGANGQIILKSSGTTLLEAGSTTSAVGGNLNRGGEIQLLGAQVALTGNASVDASGAAGGGTVLVGGDYQGKNAAVPNAQQSYLGKDSVIKADATASGDGGKVIVWSDQATRVYGGISARGGAAGGNGGFVETSGHYLDMRGAVDTRAPRGANGQLLLDPSDVYIAASAGNATAVGMLDSSTLSPSGGLFLDAAVTRDSLLLTGTLESTLATTDVTVRTDNPSGTSGGFIKVVNPVSWSAAHSLTLEASTDIYLNAAINAGGAFKAIAQNGDLTVAGNLASAGDIKLISTKANGLATVNSGIDVKSTAGNITVQADNMKLDGTMGTATQHGVLLTPYSDGTAIQVGVGAADGAGVLGLSQAELAGITLPGNGWLDVGSAVSGSGTGTGSLSVVGNLNLMTPENAGTLTLHSQGGGLTVNTGKAVSAHGVVSLLTKSGGDYRITNNGSVTSDANINLYGGTMTLAAGTLTGSAVSLGSTNNVDLGATGNPLNTLALTGADLASATTGELYIYNNNPAPGNITVSAPQTLANHLTLTATGNIALQAALGAGGLALKAGGDITATDSVNVSGLFELQGGSWSQLGSLPAFSAADFRVSDGSSFLRAAGGDGSTTPYQLLDVYGLQGIGSLDTGASMSYVLNNDISASGTANWNGGQGFKPLGNSAYAGTFDGGNKAINGLYINRSGSDNVGLISYLGSGTIKNLSLNGGAVVGRNNVGGLYGYSGPDIGQVQNVHSSVNVTGISNVGGMAGTNYAAVSDASASGIVTGIAGADASNIGGLVGRNLGAISASSASGEVRSTGFGYVGGLVGSNAGGSISHAYATGKVSSTGEIVGGLVGDNNGGDISVAYSTGAVEGGRNVGGFAGRNTDNGTISNVYSGGDVSGNTTDSQVPHANMGGLIGDLFSGTVSDSFSNGSVNGVAFNGAGVHGMIGSIEDGSLVNGYFDADKAPATPAGAGHALTTPNTKRLASFSDGLDVTGLGRGGEIDSVWRMYDGYTVPMLRAFLTPITVGVTGGASVSKTYDGAGAAFGGTLDGTLPAGISGALAFSGPYNVGVHGIGLYSTIYDISYSGGEAQLTITPAPLTVSGVTANSRVYNMDWNPATSEYGTLATLNVATGALSGVIGSDNVTLAGGTGSFADRNVGTGKAVTTSGFTLGGADGGNYAVTLPTGLTASITPAPLTVSLASRDYNNSTVATFAGAALGGVLGVPEGPLDVVSLATGGASASYADKNVGVDKAVTISGGALGLSGTDAGNYALIPGVKGTITARPLSTWSGSGGGLWSAAGNWVDGIAPDGANVLAATIGGSAGTITYDASAGNTTLARLNVGGGSELALTGGALTINGSADNSSQISGKLRLNGGGLALNGAMHVAHLVLTNGVLSGTNNDAHLHVDNLEQTGGGIDMNGSLYVNSGNSIAIGGVRAQSGIALYAGVGGITQTGPLETNRLYAVASNGITLTNSGNRVGAFYASNYYSGDIRLNNTAPTGTNGTGELALGGLLTGLPTDLPTDLPADFPTDWLTGLPAGLTTSNGNIVIDNHGGIHTGGPIHATGGKVSITAHSPITINNIVTGTDISLSASTDISLTSGSALSATNSIGMVAGSDIMLGGLLSVSSSSGSISAVATNGSISVGSATTISSSGGAVTLAAPLGTVSAASVSFGAGTVPIINSGDAAAAAQAAADAAAKAAADAAAAAAADAAAKAAADAAAKAAADAAANAAADAAAKAAADAAAKAAADAAADAAAKAAADAAAQAADAAAASGNQSTPVAQALNSTVNIINTVTQTSVSYGTNTPTVSNTPTVPSVPDGKSSGSTGGNSKADDKVPGDKDKTDSKSDRTATKNEPTKKMYCN